MATQYGVTPQGYRPMSLVEVQADLESALQSSFGDSINLAPESVFGQLVAILAERHASLYQLGQALYAARDPSAASGLSVDNLLALNNLQRLAARPTVTAPQPAQTGQGVTRYGLVLYGAPGTVVPAGALVSDGQAVPTTLALDAAVTIGAPSNARQSLVFSNAPTSGTYALTLTDATGRSVTTPALTYGQALADVGLSWEAAPSSGTYVLTLHLGQDYTSEPIPAGASAAQVQTSLRKLSPFGNVQVLAAAGGNLTLHFPDTAVPAVSAAGTAAPQVAPSLASVLNNLAAPDGTLPFTDVAVSSAGQGYQLDFGGGYVLAGQPATAASAVPLVAVATSTLASASGDVTNLTVLESRVGAPAQGVGSATATTTGPNAVLAGALTTIVTPQAGWTGVTNQLDCVTGADVETDAQALARFRALRASQGTGSLAAIVERVRQVAGVTAASGQQNLTSAAQQQLTFLGQPASGTYQLATDTGTTASLAYNATAAQVQAALAALPDYQPVRVTGTPDYGFTVDFNGSSGGQPRPLLVVAGNTTGVVLQPTYGRPPHSVEIVASGGADADVAAAVLAALPAGTGTYGAPVVATLGSVAAGSNQLHLASAIGAAPGLTVNMPGIPLGATVASVADNVLTLNQAALATLSGQPCTLTHAPLLADSAGNALLVAFSRPVPTLLYVQIQIVTDTYLTPGDPTSGLNASSQWNVANVATIKDNILAIGNAVGVGGLIVAQGTNGLVGSFNAIPGVVSYDLTFGTQPNPTTRGNLQLQANQAPAFESDNIAVAFK